MPADIDDLCTALAAQINGQAWAPNFTAVVDDTPYYTTDELATLRVTILPFNIAWDAYNRNADKLIHTVEISFQQKGAALPSPPTVDPLIALAKSLRRLQRDLAKWLRNPTNRIPPTYTSAALLNIKGGQSSMVNPTKSETEHKPLYASNLLEKERLFVGVMHLTYVETVEHS